MRMPEFESLHIKSLLNYLVKESGKTPYRISKEMNRPTNYIASLMARKTIPGLSVMADIAEQCGYGLALIGKDEAILINPGEAPTYDAEGNYSDPATDVLLELSNSRSIVVAWGETDEDRDDYLRDMLKEYADKQGS